MKKDIMLLVWVVLITWGSALLGQNSSAYDSSFSHQRHVVIEEMECSDCHEAAESSLKGEDDLLPSMEACLDCHDEGEVPDPAAYPRINDFSKTFSHKKHLDNGETCQSCHEEVVNKTEAEPYRLPDMIFCMDCHERKRAASIDCRSCHLPDENLLPASHTPGFRHNHADIARTDARQIHADKDCSVCHKTQFCEDCHEGDNLDRFTHPLNYEFTHSLEAQGKEKECAVCHSERQFCVDCHRDNQVLPHNHTAGWVNNIPHDGGRHKVEAQSDIDACISCHEQDAEEICQPCHGQ